MQASNSQEMEYKPKKINTRATIHVGSTSNEHIDMQNTSVNLPLK